MSYKLKTVYIDKAVANSSITQRFVEKAKFDQLIVDREEKVTSILSHLSLPEGKKTALLTRSKGCLVKKCPGMLDHYLCCNLNTINVISNCPASCSYCFLQFYLNNPATIIYTDLGKAAEEIKTIAKSNPSHLHRFTTGELSDSLALDWETGISAKLINLLKDIPNILLELKTKTTSVNHLLNLDHKERTVISWTLNTPAIAEKEEHSCPSPIERLKAAKKMQDAGYLLGFHFDPIVYYSSWEKDYRQTVKMLFDQVSPNKIAWISLGTLRFRPGMGEEIKTYFPKSKLPYGELITASDGKTRYIKPIRYQLYERMIEWIRKYSGDQVFVYLCMETPETWQAIMDYIPQSKEDLDHTFANQLVTRGLI